jgi:hypothetical protein
VFLVPFLVTAILLIGAASFALILTYLVVFAGHREKNLPDGENRVAQDACDIDLIVLERFLEFCRAY